MGQEYELIIDKVKDDSITASVIARTPSGVLCLETFDFSFDPSLSKIMVIQKIKERAKAIVEAEELKCIVEMPLLGQSFRITP